MTTTRAVVNRIGGPLRWLGSNGKRIAVTILGFVLVVVGVILLVLPGPGLLVVAAGLAILATEYAWARRALDETKERTRDVAGRVRRTSSGTSGGDQVP